MTQFYANMFVSKASRVNGVVTLAERKELVGEFAADLCYTMMALHMPDGDVFSGKYGKAVTSIKDLTDKIVVDSPAVVATDDTAAVEAVVGTPGQFTVYSLKYRGSAGDNIVMTGAELKAYVDGIFAVRAALAALKPALTAAIPADFGATTATAKTKVESKEDYA